MPKRRYADQATNREGNHQPDVMPSLISVRNKMRLKNKKQVESQISPKLLLIYHLISIAVNLLSIMLFLAESELQPEGSLADMFNAIDFCFSSFFLLEIILEAKKQGVSILRTFFFYIDTLTVATSYFAYFASFSLNLNFLRIIRSLKIVRINKLLKIVRVKQNDNYFSIKSSKIGALQLKTCLYILVTLFIATGAISVLNETVKGGFNNDEMRFINSLYFLISSTSSTGFGDIVPTSFISRYITLSVLVILLTVILKNGISLYFMLRMLRDEDYEFKISDHIVVCGNLTLTGVTSFVFRFYRETLDLNLTFKKIVFVVDKSNVEVEKYIKESSLYGKYVFVVSDNLHDNFVLDRVKTSECSHFFCLNSEKTVSSYTDDFFLKIIKNKVKSYKCAVYMQTLLNPIQELPKSAQLPIHLLKAAVLARGIYCKGFTTFLSNILFEDKSNNVKLEGKIENYRKSTKMKMFAVKFPSSLIGESYTTVKNNLFSEVLDNKQSSSSLDDSFSAFRMVNSPAPNLSRSFPLLIGIVNPTQRDRSNYIVFNPKDKEIMPNDKGIFIFSSVKKVKNILESLTLRVRTKSTFSFTDYCTEMMNEQNNSQSEINGSQARRVIFGREKRVLAREEIKVKLTNHIVIIGYSNLVEPLVSCIRVRNYSVSVLVVTEILPPQKEVTRLLNKFKNFQIVHGNVNNLKFLLNEVNCRKAQFVLILSGEGKTSFYRESSSVLASQLVSNFCKVKSLLEVQDPFYSKFISPIHFYDGKKELNEYYSTTFLSGEIFFSSVLEQLMPLKLLKNEFAQIIQSLIMLNFEKIQDFVTDGSQNYDEYDLFSSSTRIFSVPVPEMFVGKEYGTFLTHCFSGEEGATPLGVFLEKQKQGTKMDLIEELTHYNGSYFLTNPRADLKLEAEMEILVLGNYGKQNRARSIIFKRAFNVEKKRRMSEFRDDLVKLKKVQKIRRYIKILKEKCVKLNDVPVLNL